MDFQGGNRLFLFLPPNLYLISFSASSLSFSETHSPKHPLTNTLSLTYLSFRLPLTTRLSTQHHRHTLASHLHSSLVSSFSFSSSFSLFLAASFFSSSTCNLGLSSFILLSHSAVCPWMEDAFSHSAVLLSLTLYSKCLWCTEHPKNCQKCIHTILYIIKCWDNSGKINLSCKNSSSFVHLSLVCTDISQVAKNVN